MVGSYEVKISRRRSASYKFTVRRNITVVRGDSGTGKTTLFEMIDDHARLGEQSGVSVQCDCPCVALSDSDWKHQLKSTSGSIVFVDEGLKDIFTDEFARAILGSDNYYVLITRVDLPNLPYSVDEVYRIKTSGKYHSFEQLYKSDDKHRYYLESRAKPKRDFDVFLVEDAKSGFEFYRARFDGTLRCETADGNAKVLRWLFDHSDNRVFVVADGAAFGAYADRVLKLQNEHRDTVTVCLPESFEWLLLRSGIIKADGIDEALDDPSAHVDSRQYGSWEQFFTRLLQDSTRGTAFEYHKGRLVDAYVIPNNADKVMALIACRNVQ